MEDNNQQEQFVSMKDMTHKQLANVITHMTGRGMSADFTNPERMRDWARYWAEVKMQKPSPVLFRAGLKIKSEDKKERER